MGSKKAGELFWEAQRERYRRIIDKQCNNNPFVTINDIVYDILLDDIVSIRLQPGDKLVERQIAEVMNVSRTPVRIAFRRLEEERYVIYEKGRGVFVSTYPEEQIEAVLFTRRTLESAAAKLATQRMTPEKLRRLEAIADKSCAKAEQLTSFLAADHEFHSYLFECTENFYLIRCYSDVVKRVDLMRNYMAKYAQEDLIAIIDRQEHKMLCLIMSLGNPDVSEAYMKKHIDSMKNVTVLHPQVFGGAAGRGGSKKGPKNSGGGGIPQGSGGNR